MPLFILLSFEDLDRSGSTVCKKYNDKRTSWEMMTRKGATMEQATRIKTKGQASSLRKL
jgi:hypothetical protein